MDPKTKLALLVNMISPVRLGLFSILAAEFDLMVLHGGKEANRDSWNDVEKALTNAKVVRAWGWQFHYVKKLDGEAFDEKFIHFTPGFAWHLLRFRPNLVISNELGFRSMIALAYGTAFRKPVWIWWGGTLHTERNNGASRKIVRKVLSTWADRWLSYGHTSTEYLLSLGVKRDRILELQNTIDEKRFQVMAKPAWDIQPKPVVLYAGQFIERKGVGNLLEAAARLQQNGYSFSLLLVGSGRDKPILERRAEELGLKNVYFRSVQTPENMPSVYRSADVMVLPTFEDVWGLVANEAILSDMPVLCSKYAGCAPELFAPENIFAPEDLNEFTQKLGAAVSGRLPKTDPRRLKTTDQLGRNLVQELSKFVPSVSINKQIEPESTIR
ncbi:MAG TPA: glycosyltransferase [Candidatus Eremiobacteraceae bacterium]|nr:glycosyltransferase [Candidatus Eremiobacteraceae bacterium]